MKSFRYFLTCLTVVVVILCLGIDAQALTKEEADSILCNEVIGIDTVSHELIAFGFDSALAVGITIFPYWPEPLPEYAVDSGFYCESPHINSEPTWFYWIDDNPYAGFVHETRYVYITDSTVTVTVDTCYWWPVVDSVEWWHEDSLYWDSTYWVWTNISYIPPLELPPVPPEQPYKSGGLQEVCCLVLQGSKASWMTQNYNNMISTFQSFGFRVEGFQSKNRKHTKKKVLEKLETLCADSDCPCIWIYATSHGGTTFRTISGKRRKIHYIKWRYKRLYSYDIESKLDNCDEKKVCITWQACKSGEVIDDLGSHARVKLITTSTKKDRPSYSARRDWKWDPNPWDEGSEYTSGFAEDLRIIQGNSMAMRVARKLAKDNNTCICEALGFEAHNTGLGKDERAHYGSNKPRKKEYPKQHSRSGFPVDTCEVGIGVGDSACVVFGGNMRKRTVCWKCDNLYLPEWSWTSGCTNCPPCSTKCNCTAVPAGTKIKIGGTVVPEKTVISGIQPEKMGPPGNKVDDHWKVEVESDKDGCICLKLVTQPYTCPFIVHNDSVKGVSHILITISGSGETLRNCVVTENPPGCPAPTCVAAGDTVDISWSYCCFDFCETVEFDVDCDFPCDSLEIASVELESPFELRIREEFAYPCQQYVDVPVTLCNVDSVGGYNILIHWDCTLAELVDVEQKYYYADGDSFQFEYFNWTTWEVDDGCKVRIVGLHDKPNDEDTPPIPPGQDRPLFDLIFHPSNTWDLNYSIPITFEIDECGDNALSDPTGYVLYTPPGPGDAYGDTTCPLNPPPDPYPDPSNPSVELYDGYIYAEYLDRGEFVGDINLNGTKYEVADATLYLECLNGEATLIDEDRQRTASDINLDGTPWSIADVVLLIDIINGYATPLAKALPTEEVANVSILGNAVSAKFAVPVGGAYFVINHAGEAGEPVLGARAKDMDLKWSERNGELRVILYNWESKRMEPGSGVLFTVPGAISLTISEVQFSDANGSLMKVRSVPSRFALAQNYPNPFNLTTRIAFDLPEDVEVTLTVYNISGQKVADLVKGKVEAGHHTVSWNVRDVSSGIYFYRIKAGDFTATRKMVLLK